MKEQYIEKIRKACIAANPDKKNGCCGEEWREHFCPNCSNRIPFVFRLADVLLAIENRKSTTGFAMSSDGQMMSTALGRGYYDLRADDLTLQSEETLKFISDLLTL